jgi:DNA-binding PucR family transcriptional regulator
MNEASKRIGRQSLQNFIEYLQDNPDLVNTLRNMLGNSINFPAELTVRLKND